MRWFKNLKLGVKLMLSFGMILFLVIGFSVYSIIMSNSINNNYTYMSEYSVNRLEMWLNIDVNLNKAYQALAMMSVYAPNEADTTSSATGTVDTVSSATGTVDTVSSATDAVDATSSATVAEGIKKNMDAQHDIIKSALTDIRLDIEVCRESTYNDPNLSKQEEEEQDDLIKDILYMLTVWENEVVAPVKEANLIGDRWAVSEVYKKYIEMIDTLGSTIDKLSTDAKGEAAEIKVATSEDAANTIMVLVIIAVITVILGIVLAQSITIIIKKPIDNMTALFREVAIGNVDVSIDRSFITNDEIGELIKGFIGLIDNTKQQIFVAEHIAAGDLTVDIHKRSDKDAMNIALHKMAETLNIMLSEINTATAQVFLGSKQLSESSQSLAMGSTEQSAAVEQLSSSISEISEKTKTNANTANKAANLANTIMSNAEKGSLQMSEMMTAVKEINEASLNINKVIKVIDDIAFQTNILALNAAVEAARAGQHGKGFAVVAEEVRNLASKSAEAAKDTGILITSTIEKAALGERIASDTSASLTEMVSGISESTQLVEEVAKSSEEQAISISHLNIGIEQVANVIQQNSAAAEESSAASEEMNGQAGIMENMVSRFKLRDNS